jgi:TM2 domain-containing membrane protein YozV
LISSILTHFTQLLLEGIAASEMTRHAIIIAFTVLYAAWFSAVAIAVEDTIESRPLMRAESFPEKPDPDTQATDSPMAAGAQSYQSYEIHTLSNSTGSMRSGLTSALKKLEYELNIGDGTDATQKSKVRLALLSQFFFFGFFGFDRCYMDQYLLGAIKCLTGGGFAIWAILDFMVVFWNMMTSKTSISMLGFAATFKQGAEVDDAFWVSLLMLTFTFSTSGLLAYYWSKGAFDVWPFASADSTDAADGTDPDKPKETSPDQEAGGGDKPAEGGAAA